MNNKSKHEAEMLRYLVLAAQRQGNRMLNDKLAHLGLTSSKAEVLRVLDSYQPLSVREIGELLVCETGSPSRLIKSMVEAGLIVRITNPSDSRSTLLKLSQTGKGKTKEVKEIEEQLYADFNKVLTEKEISDTNAVLSKLVRSMTDTSGLEKRNLI
ncbi:MarR family transcriptional regulator [Halobacillus locisalis]|uniref:MarR family transcriptional regulator n=1 Tax=Halobacillus locisalis TaxID=220753 RepID=A0A838CVW8_9BACI|nr:winged helix DNA-binding protein [Halobacillus locisalis]MBA2176063.1 MarR family transcriptional regulator [Halobacillus locisalis]